LGHEVTQNKIFLFYVYGWYHCVYGWYHYVYGWYHYVYGWYHYVYGWYHYVYGLSHSSSLVETSYCLKQMPDGDEIDINSLTL